MYAEVSSYIESYEYVEVNDGYETGFCVDVYVYVSVQLFCAHEIEVVPHSLNFI